MKNVANTIEDLLEILAGLQLAPKMQLESTDATIMQSIARQVFKGTALTDRQYALMKEKLQNYRDQFTALEYDFDRAVETLRQPLRHIDRSKYIKIVDTSVVYSNDEVFESYKSNWKWIEVRFPFSKKIIMKINDIATSSYKQYIHHKGSHQHFFKLNEKNTLKILNMFQNTEFEIDKELIDFFNKIDQVYNCRDNHIPKLSNTNILNLNDSALKLAESELGKIQKDNLVKYVDRQRRYGIVECDNINIAGNLTEKISTRPNIEMLFKPEEYRLEDILKSLDDLQRYPLLVILEENNAEEQLYRMHNFYKDFLPNEEQSVLFRLDGNTNSEFNNLVKEYRLNNWVDNTTKIVYINDNKLPKILFKCEWTPMSAITFNSRINRNIDLYIKEHCDMVAYYDNEISPLRRHSRYYG